MMNTRWYIARQRPNGPTKFGPATLEQLRQLAARGKLKPGDLVCQEGMQEWVSASLVIQPQLEALTTLPPLPASPQLPVPLPQVQAGHTLVPAPEHFHQSGVVVSTSEPRHGPTSFTKGMLIGGGVAALALFGMCGLFGVLFVAGISNQNQPVLAKTKMPDQPPPAPRRTGTITFAEYVDPETFQSVNEGRVFSQGSVNLLMQSNLPFNDTKVVITYRPVGSAVWKVLGEYTVDPSWNKFTTSIRLSFPGGYRIKATNSKGETIAEDEIQITGF